MKLNHIKHRSQDSRLNSLVLIPPRPPGLTLPSRRGRDNVSLLASNSKEQKNYKRENFNN